MGLDVLAGEETASAGGAEGGGDEGIRELGAFAGDAVDVWCFEEGVAGVAEGVPAHVVDEDEDEIGFGGGFGEDGGGEEAEGLATGESGHGTYLTSLGLEWGTETLRVQQWSNAQLLQDLPREIFIDFGVAWDGLGDTCFAILIPIVLAAMPDELTANFFEFADQVLSFHDERLSSAMRRIPGISPLVKSR